VVNVTDQDEKNVESILSTEVDEAQRQAVRENAKRVLRESGLAEMLKTLNKNVLKGREKSCQAGIEECDVPVGR